MLKSLYPTAEVHLETRQSRSIEWFIEDQTFSPSYDLAPPPPLPPPLSSESCLSFFSVFLCVAGWAYWRERGGGEPYHATARKPGPNYSIGTLCRQYCICRHCVLPEFWYKFQHEFCCPGAQRSPNPFCKHQRQTRVRFHETGRKHWTYRKLVFHYFVLLVTWRDGACPVLYVEKLRTVTSRYLCQTTSITYAVHFLCLRGSVADPGCVCRISNPRSGFFPIPDPRVKKAPDPGAQRCFVAFHSWINTLLLHTLMAGGFKPQGADPPPRLPLRVA